MPRKLWYLRLICLEVQDDEPCALGPSTAFGQEPHAMGCYIRDRWTSLFTKHMFLGLGWYFAEKPMPGVPLSIGFIHLYP